MKMQKPLELPPRALRRNRLMLGVTAVAIVAAMTITVITAANDNRHMPTMLAVVDDAAQPELTANIATIEPASAVIASETLAIETHDAEIIEPDSSHNTTESPVSGTVMSEASIDPENPGDPDTRYFNGRPVRPLQTLVMEVTGYSPDARSCGKYADGITASGYSVWTNNMHLAAADTSLLPFGSMISVPGYDRGAVIPVLDRGGAIKGKRLDLLFPTHEAALQWGRKRIEVTVWEYADGKPNDFVRRYR